MTVHLKRSVEIQLVEQPVEILSFSVTTFLPLCTVYMPSCVIICKFKWPTCDKLFMTLINLVFRWQLSRSSSARQVGNVIIMGENAALCVVSLCNLILNCVTSTRNDHLLYTTAYFRAIKRVVKPESVKWMQYSYGRESCRSRRVATSVHSVANWQSDPRGTTRKGAGKPGS